MCRHNKRAETWPVQCQVMETQPLLQIQTHKLAMQETASVICVLSVRKPGPKWKKHSSSLTSLDAQPQPPSQPVSSLWFPYWGRKSDTWEQKLQLLKTWLCNLYPVILRLDFLSVHSSVEILNLMSEQMDSTGLPICYLSRGTITTFLFQCSEMQTLHKNWVKTQSLILSVVFGFWL